VFNESSLRGLLRDTCKRWHVREGFAPQASRQIHRLLRRDRKLQRFGSARPTSSLRNHNPPRNETEIFPGVQHFRQQYIALVI